MIANFLQMFSKSNENITIAVDSFCSTFHHQEKPKQPLYICLYNTLLQILKLPVQLVSVMITQPFLRNLALLRGSKT